MREAASNSDPTRRIRLTWTIQRQNGVFQRLRRDSVSSLQEHRLSLLLSCRNTSQTFSKKNATPIEILVETRHITQIEQITQITQITPIHNATPCQITGYLEPRVLGGNDVPHRVGGAEVSAQGPGQDRNHDHAPQLGNLQRERNLVHTYDMQHSNSE